MSISSSLRGVLVRIQWILWVALAYLVALLAAWQLLAEADFLFPLWYDVIGIEQTIARYAPQNRYRPDFAATPREERMRLFSAIVDAIHNQGGGLESLMYHDSLGRPIARFLTAPEIVHLKDVSRLVDSGLKAGWGAAFFWLLLLGWLRMQRPAMPSVRKMLFNTFMIAGAVAVLVLLIGPVRVFYRLHNWVFPAGHGWFFYYQDSLMTMLMKAPDLFGYITLSLGLLNFLLFAGLLALSRKIIGATGRSCAAH